MFKEFEEDYDLINNRIQRLESDMQNLQSKQKSHTTRRKLDYHKPDSDDSSTSLFPFKPQSNNNVSSHTPPTEHYHNTYYRGPNIDYLYKNVNITCTEQNQILEFYIEF